MIHILSAEKVGSPLGRPNSYILGIVVLSALLFFLRGVYVMWASAPSARYTERIAGVG